MHRQITLIAIMLVLVSTSLMEVSRAGAQSAVYFVDPDGSDDNSGLQPNRPFRTVQRALEMAQPGDTIQLAPETYYQDVATVRDGTAEAPITITGTSESIIAGTGSDDYLFEVTHDYITLESFTINGRQKDYGEGNVAGYRKKLLYIYGQQANDTIEGVRLINMTFRNAGEECVRLRYFVQRTEIAYSSFEHCGIYDFELGGEGKVGEALYIGTSSTQWERNPTKSADESAFNWIHHNRFETHGNECVDLKEGTHNNIIEFNTCTAQSDNDSGGFGVRGNDNTIRYNEIYENDGAGIRIGGHTVDGVQYGENNHVYGNILYDNTGGAIKYEAPRQGIMCGNNLWDNAGGNTIGEYAHLFSPEAACQDVSTIQSQPENPF